MEKPLNNEQFKGINTESETLELDKTDKKILNLLQKNNQLTNLELAELVSLSPPPCLRRVRRLRESGVIMHDVALVDPFKIKQNLISFVSVSLEKVGEDFLHHFEQKMSGYPEVKQCYFISGEIDYLLVIHVEDIAAYNEFIRRTLVNAANVKVFRSNFCLSRIKYDTSILLPED